MKTILFFLALTSIEVNAQRLKWHKGSVVLSEGIVLTGSISIEPRHDLILFRTTGNPTVYPAHKLKSVYFYDCEANINRRFISMEYKEGIATNDRLLEVVTSGEVSILRRMKNVIYSYQASEATDYNYYCKYDGALVPLRKFTKKIFPSLMSKEHNRLRGFMKENRLQSAMDADAIQIIEYYNRLAVSRESFTLNQ
ncbi:MAG: hypothetical protein ABIS36_09025 [Chryseolinea sp.]